nr:DNA helicase [Rhodospirillales bacterium]
LIGHSIPRLAVEGLDPVDWAEEEGGRRRGRRTAPARTAPARAGAASSGRAERVDRPRRERAPKPPGPPPAPPTGARETDSRTPVTGFGADVPAFMRISRRTPAAAESEPEASA